MPEIQQANWETDAEILKKIRRVVFIEEQNVSDKDEWDEHDETALHLIAFNNKKPAGVVRYLKTGKLTRLAVLKEYRHQRIATELITRIIQIAKNDGQKTLYLDAQIDVTTLYKNLGFKTVGTPFMDAGIRHIRMEMSLSD